MFSFFFFFFSLFLFFFFSFIIFLFFSFFFFSLSSFFFFLFHRFSFFSFFLFHHFYYLFIKIGNRKLGNRKLGNRKSELGKSENYSIISKSSYLSESSGGPLTISASSLHTRRRISSFGVLIVLRLNSIILYISNGGKKIV